MFKLLEVGTNTLEILEGKEMWKIPGISVVVVKNDSTLYKKTFGKKNYFKDEKVDTKTIFSMASTTKALVSMSLGILVIIDVLYLPKPLLH